MATIFTLATWNILATAYIRRDYYPGTPQEVLDARRRIPRLVESAVALDVDILCLQEVEADVFAALDERLSTAGYAGRLAMKAYRRPDGCATFFRRAACELLGHQRYQFADATPGSKNSGHVAQFLELRIGKLHLQLANTHLKWDPPGVPDESQWSYRQVQQIITALNEFDAQTFQIVCGDFNVTEAATAIRLLNAAGFRDTHRAGPETYTCNSNGEPKLIDHILYRGRAEVLPAPLPHIDAATALPSPDQPSDHLPLVARFTVGEFISGS